METTISVDTEQDLSREQVDQILEQLREEHPKATVSLEEPKGAFPPIGDPLTLVIAINASVQLAACLYPRIKRLFSEFGGSTDLLELDEFAVEYLGQHTRVTRDQLDLEEKSRSGSYITYTYEYLEDGSTHYIEINDDDPTDWYYEEQ